MAAGQHLRPTRWPHLSGHTWAACAFSYTDGRLWAGPSSLLPRLLGMGPPCMTAGPLCIKHPGCPPEAGETETAPFTRCRHTGRQAHRGSEGEAVLLLCIHVWSLGTHSAPLLQLCPLCQHLPQPPTAPPQLLITHEHGLRGPQPPNLCPGARTERRRWGQKGLQADSSSAAQRVLGDSRQGVDWGEAASCFRRPSLSWGSQFIGLDRFTGSP